jgi:hypothetical protein
MRSMTAETTPRQPARWTTILRKRGLLIVIALATGYAWYLDWSNPCGLPIHFGIGTIDPRFLIDQPTAVALANDAEAMWENSVGKELLVYDRSSDFKIDFIFDERQQAIIDRQSLEHRLAQLEAKHRRMRAAAKEAATTYEALKAQHDALLADYESRLAQYNETVDSWNTRGGAPRSVIDAINREAAALRLEADRIESLRQQANAEADGVNAIVESGSSVVDTYNASVAKFKSEHRDDPDEQAVYESSVLHNRPIPRAIHVYAFSDPKDLVRVLAHEFGHALRVEHENVSTSIMKPVANEHDEELRITDASVAALKAECKP